VRRKGAAWTGFHSSVVEARNSGAPAHLQLKRITSILPRAREKQRRESVRREAYDSNQANKHICHERARIARSRLVREQPTRRRRGAWEEEEGRNQEENKLQRVRGGCLGAQDRRRTRRPAKRSGGAACKRRALRFRMGQPLQSDVWRPVGEHIAHRGAAGELKHLSSPTKRNQVRFPQ
jgi:hypothetical protein